MDNYGIVSLVPVLCVVFLVFWTKRTMASLAIGSVIGAILLYGYKFFMPWLDAIYGVLSDGTWQWLFLVCGLFGSIIGLFEASGGAMGFTKAATKICKGKKQSLFMTWLLGIVVFADDWLNALAVGAAMRNVTDKFKVPRELLAYVICATGAVVCTLIPFSTWGVFMAGQLESNGVCEAGEGMSTYIHMLPYIFYAVVALVVVPLYIAGVIPHFGAMKRAELRVVETGQLLPDSTKELYKAEEEVEESTEEQKPKRAFNFLVPLLVLVVVTIITQEMLYGIFACLVVCALLYFPQRLMSFADFCGAMISGFKDMLGVIGIITAAFILKAMNNELGLPSYVIGLVQDSLDPRLLPMVAFIVVGLLCFAAGNFWGMLAIAFPVIIPIAISLDANLMLTSAAMISGCVFGSNACFFGSEVSLTCTTTQIANQDYAKTALPIVAIPVVISIVLYAVFGFTMA